jgi:hypothetical protein
MPSQVEVPARIFRHFRRLGHVGGTLWSVDNMCSVEGVQGKRRVLANLA